mgnify:CR=1 FL=1
MCCSVLNICHRRLYFNNGWLSSPKAQDVLEYGLWSPEILKSISLLLFLVFFYSKNVRFVVFAFCY